MLHVSGSTCIRVLQIFLKALAPFFRSPKKEIQILLSCPNKSYANIWEKFLNYKEIVLLILNIFLTDFER